LYGQHRLASGRSGEAMPAATEEEFLSAGAALADGAPIAFRAELWRPGVASADADEAVGGARTAELMRAAGFAGSWFLDGVLPADADASPTTRPAAEPRAATPAAAHKVSCLMVTRDRLALAKRAIRCFAAQTHPDCELVVLCDGDPRVRAG